MRITGTMQLYHNDKLLGTLERYSYETPWASAWLQAHDSAIIQHFAAVYSFLEWVETIPDDLPDAEADARYMQALAERGLDEAQIRDFHDGWAVRTADGEMNAIVLAIFEQDGYLTWRW
jgi:hypothetical protein